MTGHRRAPHLAICAAILLGILAGGSSGQTHAPTPETCSAVMRYCTRLENIINGYKESMATGRLRRGSWREAELHYSEMSWLYRDFNYLKRVDFSFSPSKPYKDHIHFASELLLSYEFALDQVQLDLSLHPERNDIHMKKTTDIAKQLQLLQSEIRQEASRANAPSDREDVEYFLASSYIPLSANDFRKDRHFLTLLEMLKGMEYIKEMFSNC